MRAGKYQIVIEQGATFTLQLVWKDANGVAVDLTGYAARMQVRRGVEVPDTLLSLTSAGGGIVLGGAAGSIAISVPASVTQTLDPGSAVYDLEMESPSGFVTRLLQGRVIISPEVTR
jgi:hypothetical protein